MEVKTTLAQGHRVIKRWIVKHNENQLIVCKRIALKTSPEKTELREEMIPANAY